MNGKGKATYELSEEGSVVVVDRRHLTNGAIVPNYVVDLYLPIIGYAGLGVLTLLYRFVNRASHDLILDLHKHALAGGVGFPRLVRLLDLLRECQIITIEKPAGLARRLHHRTRIELLDAPTEAPAKFTEQIIRRTPAGWLLNQEVLGSTSIKVPGSTSMEVPGSTSIKVPDSTSMEVPGSTLIEVPDGTLIEVPGSTSIKVPGGTSMLDVPTGDVPTGDAPSPPGGDGGRTLTETWMVAEGFSRKAARRHRDLDLVAAQADYRRRRDLGQGHGAIVEAWDIAHPVAPAADPQHDPLDEQREAAYNAAYHRALALLPHPYTQEQISLAINLLVDGASDDQVLDALAALAASTAGELA